MSTASLVAVLNSIATLQTMKSETTSESQSAEAARLRALFNEKKGRDISQEEFGARYEIGSQGMIWQYLNGRRPLNLKAAIGFARGLGVPLEEVSPEIAEQVAMASKLCGNEHLANVFHRELPLEEGQQKFPIDVTKALQSALTAFRTGADVRSADLRTIIWHALTPVESGNIANTSSADVTEHERAIVERATAALKRTGNEHVEPTRETPKKRHQS